VFGEGDHIWERVWWNHDFFWCRFSLGCFLNIITV